MCVYIVAGIIAIVAIPGAAVPIPAKTTNDERAKLVEARNKVRDSVIKVVGGIAALATFIVTIQTIRLNEDNFNQTKATLFAKTVSSLMDDSAKLNSRAEALYVLSYIARADRSYHRAVFDVISSRITEASSVLCRNESFRQTGYTRDAFVQIAMRILGERNPDHDPTGKRFNIEHACLPEIDLRDEENVVRGLKNARLSQAIMLRVDFTRVGLPGAELMGIVAGDYLNPGWSPGIGRGIHQGAKGDSRNQTVNGEQRRGFVAHFIDADLRGANFEGAGLQGADFSGAKLEETNFTNASISRTSFKGAQGLKAEQLLTGCAGRADWTKEANAAEQPYLWPELRQEVEAKGGIPACR
jgi:uncharacterized protein YjbI with pentapeptide repeats